MIKTRFRTQQLQQQTPAVGSSEKAQQLQQQTPAVGSSEKVQQLQQQTQAAGSSEKVQQLQQQVPAAGPSSSTRLQHPRGLIWNKSCQTEFSSPACAALRPVKHCPGPCSSPAQTRSEGNLVWKLVPEPDGGSKDQYAGRVVRYSDNSFTSLF